MSDVIQLRPEVMELVREIAQRPDSVLLRVKPGTEMRALREDRAWLTGAESNSSRAERHLVEVYREEVAFALRQVAWVALCGDDAGHGKLIRRQVASSETPRPDPRAAAVAISRAMADSPEGVVDGSTRALLEACSDPRSGRSANVLRLCAAAQRLSPSFRARHLAAAWHTLHGREAPALLLARHAIATGHDAMDEALTWTMVAEVHSQSKRWDRAEVASAAAIRAFPELLSPYLVQAWCAIHVADEGRAQAALLELSRIVGGRPGPLVEHIERIAGLRVVMRESMNEASGRVLLRVVDGPVKLAGELFHAIL